MSLLAQIKQKTRQLLLSWRNVKASFFLYDGLKQLYNKFTEMQSEDKDVQFGDVVGVSRVFYEHYGIYTGDDQIIHYTTSEDSHHLVIKKTDMRHFLKDSTTFFILDCEYKKPHKSRPIIYRGDTLEAQLNDYLAYLTKVKVFSQEETVQRAESRIGEEEYNLLTNNCEHFAIWCKTGINQSHQIEEFLLLVPRITLARPVLLT